MDDKVQAILDIYHKRMEEEHAAAKKGALTEDWFNYVLLAVGPDTGRLINLIARGLKAPVILEIGTSFGYSTIWLAEAARASGGRVISLELARHKSEYAQDMLKKAGLADFVEFRVGGAVELINAMDEQIDLVLLDLWKDLYTRCLDAFLPGLNPGAIIIADNMVSPGGPDVDAYARAVRAVPEMETVRLPVGTGLDVSHYQAKI